MRSNQAATEFLVLYGVTVGMVVLFWDGLDRWGNASFARGLLLGLVYGHLLPSLYTAWRTGRFAAQWWHRVVGFSLLPPVGGALVYFLARPMARGFTSGALLSAALGASLIALSWPRFQQGSGAAPAPDESHPKRR